MNPDTALIVVDMQWDFLDGGALAVKGGNQIIEPINKLMASGEYRVVVATLDWHPEGHISFASRWGAEPFTVTEAPGTPDHPFMSAFMPSVPTFRLELWPDHCVQGTPGAELAINSFLANVVLPKGSDRDREEYSGFNTLDGKDNSILAGFLHFSKIKKVDVVGLAYDFCVKNTAVDAVRNGFETTVIKSLTRSVFPENDADTSNYILSHNVRIR